MLARDLADGRARWVFRLLAAFLFLAVRVGERSLIRNVVLLVILGAVLMEPYPLLAQAVRKQSSFAFDDFLYSVDAIAFSPDGKLLAIGGGHYVAKKLLAKGATFPVVGKVLVFDFPSGKLRHKLGTDEICIDRVAFSPDSKRIIAAYNHGALWMWDTSTGNNLFAIGGAHRLGIGNLIFAKDGKRLVTGGGDHLLKVWDSTTMKPLVTVFFPFLDTSPAPFGPSIRDRDRAPVTRTHPRSVLNLSSIRFSPDEKSLLVATGDPKVLFIDPKTGKVQRTLDTRHKGVNDFALAPDSRTLATMEAFDDDNTVHLWDIRTSKFLGVLNKGRNLVGGCTFAPDGKTLVSGQVFTEGVLRIYDFSTMKIRYMIGNMDSECISRFAFSPDGKTIATIIDGYPPRLQFRNLATGKELSMGK